MIYNRAHFGGVSLYITLNLRGGLGMLQDPGWSGPRSAFEPIQLFNSNYLLCKLYASCIFHDIFHKKSKCEIGFFCGQYHMVN